MALVLSMREDDDFYIGDERFIVFNVKGPHLCLQHGDKEIIIPSDKMVEVLPTVKICEGERQQENIARLVIEAPIEIPIVRGDLKRKGENDREIENNW